MPQSALVTRGSTGPPLWGLGGSHEVTSVTVRAVSGNSTGASGPRGRVVTQVQQKHSWGSWGVTLHGAGGALACPRCMQQEQNQDVPRLFCSQGPHLRARSSSVSTTCAPAAARSAQGPRAGCSRRTAALTGHLPS